MSEASASAPPVSSASAGLDVERFVAWMRQIESSGGGLEANHYRVALFYHALDPAARQWYAERFGSLDYQRASQPFHSYQFPDFTALLDEYESWRSSTPTVAVVEPVVEPVAVRFDLDVFLLWMRLVETCGGGARLAHYRVALFHTALDADAKRWYADRFGSLDYHIPRQAERRFLLPDFVDLIAEYRACHPPQPATTTTTSSAGPVAAALATRSPSTASAAPSIISVSVGDGDGDGEDDEVGVGRVARSASSSSSLCSESSIDLPRVDPSDYWILDHELLQHYADPAPAIPSPLDHGILVPSLSPTPLLHDSYGGSYEGSYDDSVAVGDESSAVPLDVAQPESESEAEVESQPEIEAEEEAEGEEAVDVGRVARMGGKKKRRRGRSSAAYAAKLHARKRPRDPLTRRFLPTSNRAS